MPVDQPAPAGDHPILEADGPAVEPRHEVPRPVTVSAPRADDPSDPRAAAAVPLTGATAASAAAATAATGVVAPSTSRPRVDDELDAPLAPQRRGRGRARKVRRIVRHVEPWSVLKISVLFYAALFAILCVASALLWSAARTAGTVEDAESFITSVGGFGNCEPIDGETPVTTTTAPGAATTGPVDQLDPAGTDTTVPAAGETEVVDPGDDEDCREGEELVGEFKFEDGKIFQAFILGGIVLVLAGAAANVVLAVLFNLMSDLTGGVRVTVLEEDPPPRKRPARTGSPGPEPRG